MKKFFWIAIAVILLLLGVCAWQIRGSRTMNDPQILAKLVAEPIIYDSGGLVDFVAMLNARSAREVRPEENAFIDYARILGPLNRSDAEQIELCKLLQIDSIESPQPYVGVSAALGPNGPGNDPQAWDQVLLRPWTNEAFPNHANWLEQNAGHVVAIHAAARKPKYFYPLQPRIDPGSKGCRVMNCTLEYTQQMRELAQLLSAHAMNLVGRDELRSAFQDLESIHRMAAQVGQGLFLMEKLVGIAIDGYAFAAAPALLDSPQLTPADLSDYRRFLRDNPLELQLAESLATAERFASLDALVPAQIVAVPPDRFTQQALIYRVFEDGFELISVGQDGKFDDDPSPKSTKDICFIVRPIQFLNPAIPVEAPVQ